MTPGERGPSHHTVLRWPYASSTISIPTHQVLALLSPLGLSDRHSVATQVLELLGAHLGLAQCTIFSFEPKRAPLTIAVGDRDRTRGLAQIAQLYTRRYWHLDPVLDVMHACYADAGRCSAERPLIVLHKQHPEDIAHAAYRHTCYDTPKVAQRIALLSRHGRRWLSLNLYRGWEHGPIGPAQWQLVQELAPLMVQAIRLHHASEQTQADLMPLMMERLLARHPQLSVRDLDVARALLEGLDQRALAQRLGLHASSAPTYCRRLYRKLGVSGRAELTAQLLSTPLGEAAVTHRPPSGRPESARSDRQ